MPVEIGDLTLYTVEELSELFDVQAKTIRRMLRDGEIKGRKLARRWYTTEEELREYFLQPEEEA
jgi:excisionase family DNA binding protein